MTPLLRTLFARYRSMSWGQHGYALIVVLSIFAFGWGGANHWQARNYEQMYQRVAKSGARATRSIGFLANEDDAYFLALLGDFSCVAITGVVGSGPDCTINASLLRDLRDYPEVSRLRLTNAPLKHEDFQSIYELENLRWLNLAYDPLTDADLAGIDKLQNLDSLELQFTALTDVSIPLLAKLPNLSSIDISGTDITPAGAERLRWEYRLAQGTQATTTVIYRPAPTPRFREAVLRLLPTGCYGIDNRNPDGGMRLMLRPDIWEGHEQELPWIAELADVETVTSQGFPLSVELLDSIAKFPKLRQLNIAEISVTNLDLSKLAGCRNLRTIRLTGMKLDSNFVNSVARLDSLDTLILLKCQLSKEACVSVGNIRAVRSLRLQHLDVERGAFAQLLTDLENSPRLRLLELANVPINNESIPSLGRLKQLASLSLGSPEISDAAVPGLSAFTHLQQLDIGNTLVSMPGQANIRDGASQLEAALLAAKVRVVYPMSKLAVSSMNLEQLDARKAQDSAAATPAANSPTSSASKSLELPSR